MFRPQYWRNLANSGLQKHLVSKNYSKKHKSGSYGIDVVKFGFPCDRWAPLPDGENLENVQVKPIAFPRVFNPLSIEHNGAKVVWSSRPKDFVPMPKNLGMASKIS